MESHKTCFVGPSGLYKKSLPVSWAKRNSAI